MIRASLGLNPVNQRVLTAAFRLLTLDILRVINNEVAVPHHREIHRKLADLHPLIQILEAPDGEEERRWKQDKRGGCQKAVWECKIPTIPGR